MSRACGLPEYKGEKSKVFFRINFGKTMIDECPNSHCKWDYVGEAFEAYQYYEDGYLPEVYDKELDRPLSILDQSDFFTMAHGIVKRVKNKTEAKQYEAMQQKSKHKGKTK